MEDQLKKFVDNVSSNSKRNILLACSITDTIETYKAKGDKTLENVV